MKIPGYVYKVTDQESHWVSVADLMAGLMMVFLLIAVLFMVHTKVQQQQMTEVVVLYDRLKKQLYDDLMREFYEDFRRWGAILTPDLSIRFGRVEALFDEGEVLLKPEFQDILTNFFPRYINILTQIQYKPDILEVRLEGHTSTNWRGATSFDEAYILNMALSQARTRSTLAYLLQLPISQMHKHWIVKHLTANGLSSAHVIKTQKGLEDEHLSRRVEFRVVTNAERKIATLLEDLR